jgi:hypothetical protein
MVIVGESGDRSGLVLTRPDDGAPAASDTMVVFHRYGSQNYLRQVAIQGVNRAARVQEGSREREAQKAHQHLTEVRVMARRY